MRLFRAAVAVALASVVSGPPPLLAESPGRVSGHVIDAAGRPLPSLRVEFLEALRGQPLGVPLQAQLTDGRGAWSFSGVPAGNYVVRMVDRDRTVGVPVSVAESSGLTGVLIVAPSLPPPARISMAQGAAAGAGGVSNAAIVVGTAAAAAAAAVVVVVVRDES